MRELARALHEQGSNSGATSNSARTGPLSQALSGKELLDLASAWFAAFQKVEGADSFELRSGMFGGVMVPEGDKLANRKRAQEVMWRPG